MHLDCIQAAGVPAAPSTPNRNPSFLGNACARVAAVGRGGFRRANKLVLGAVAGAAVLIGLASPAVADPVNYSPVSYASGAVTFTPANSVDPIIQGAIALIGVVFALYILWKLAGMVIGFLGRRR